MTGYDRTLPYRGLRVRNHRKTPHPNVLPVGDGTITLSIDSRMRAKSPCNAVTINKNHRNRPFMA